MFGIVIEKLKIWFDIIHLVKICYVKSVIT